MLRRLFTVLPALSLLLCAAVVLLWVRSYWVADVFTWGRWGPASGYSGKTIASVRGRFLWNETWLPRRREPPADLGLSWKRHEPWDDPIPPPAEAPAWERAGFFWAWLQDDAIGVHLRAVSAPHWAPVSLLALLPTWWVVRNCPRARRGHARLCKTCGYDLRATPSRCPECGMLPAGMEP